MSRDPVASTATHPARTFVREVRHHPPSMVRVVESDLVELIEAVVAAVDTSRSWEVERVAAAFELFDGSDLFTDELRANGCPMPTGCVCEVEGWLS